MKTHSSEPMIQVGIVKNDIVQFVLHGRFSTGNKHNFSGEHTISVSNGKLLFEGELLDEIQFIPQNHATFFEIKEVTIGIRFHWERNEDQRFRGILKFIVVDNDVQAINIVHVEDYLTSVISSEMSATSSLELLKAHAVISRSWLLNKLEGRRKTTEHSSKMACDEEKIIRWYDHQDHTHFDVCADDHCQRYQGITKESTETVKQAISETYGQVLCYDNDICDARFYKACGGMTEAFENCWEDVHHPYLIPVTDWKENFSFDLKKEEDAEKWILSSPMAYCNTRDKKILSQVLNNYDQETTDFYRWKVEYSQKELSALVKEKSGIDFGRINDLIPIKRGASARIIELKIVGEKKALIIGKELEIRKILSPSHLYSSAFFVKKETRGDELYFILHGAGWGHGVGLCQIGAAVMASMGIGYNSILQHYYPNSELKQLYNERK